MVDSRSKIVGIKPSSIIDNTSSWLVKRSSSCCDWRRIIYLFGKGNKTPIEIKSSFPTIEDWKYKEQKLGMMPPKIQQLEN